MSDIFFQNAPRLWAAGLPIIPLAEKEKNPIPYGWQRFNDQMPNTAEQSHWLTANPRSNLGMVMGSQSGCIALDIDTTDEALISIIESLLPPSPWHRFGAKGKVILFKYNGEKTFRIKDVEGHTICELLSAKTQIVIPPSIHPKTQKPYTATTDLVEAIPQLVCLPKDIEDILRGAFKEYGIELSQSGWTRTTDYVSHGSRDVKMTSIAGLFANGITRGELSVKQAIERMHAWHSACTETIAGDPIDITKGINTMLGFLVSDVIGPKKKPLPTGWDEGYTPEELEKMGLKFTDEQVEWTFEQIKTYLFMEFEKKQDPADRNKIIEYGLDKIHRSPSMTTLEEESLLKYIAGTNSKLVSVPILRKRLKEMRSGGILGVNHTEIAEEAIKILEKTGLIRKNKGQIWQWAGSHWEPIPDQEVLKMIAEEFGDLPAASKANDHKGILTLMGNLIPQNIDPIGGVNFANGFLNSDGELVPHAPEFGMLYTLNYRYVKDKVPSLENAPMFSKFLYSVWGHEKDYQERLKALREVMAITFMGMGPSFARAVLLYGIAGSGKTQLLQIMQNLLPRSVISYVPPYLFNEKFEPYKLSTSLLNVCGELDEKKPIPGASFKSIIDGSIMQGQQKFGQTFDFKPKCTHWFASNHTPRSNDHTEGFFRRWVIFSFNRVVPNEEKIRDLGDIISAEEREAIAAWILSDIKTIIHQPDVSLFPSHWKVLSEIISENDTVFFFLTSEKGPRGIKKASGEPGFDNSVKMLKDKLYEHYTGFCYSGANAKPVGLRRFEARLRELGILMGFKTDDMMVYGLTMEKDVQGSVPLAQGS